MGGSCGHKRVPHPPEKNFTAILNSLQNSRLRRERLADHFPQTNLHKSTNTAISCPVIRPEVGQQTCLIFRESFRTKKLGQTSWLIRLAETTGNPSWNVRITVKMCIISWGTAAVYWDTLGRSARALIRCSHQKNCSKFSLSNEPNRLHAPKVCVLSSW